MIICLHFHLHIITVFIIFPDLHRLYIIQQTDYAEANQTVYYTLLQVLVSIIN